VDREEQIIQQVLAGDTDAFRWIIEQYQLTVFHVIVAFIHDRSAAEDLSQEVFIAAFAKLSTHDAMRCKFSTWLLTIARNRSINYLRRRTREKAALPVNQNPNADPARGMRREEFYQQLDRALNKLPQRQKRAFVLAEFQQLPYEEIAQIECISIGTVRSRIHRAKKKLRSLMKDEAS
jgi:RNA polymerase sigma-70 factor, ECF subfamily